MDQVDRRQLVLITGCSSGIGQSLALQFAARGCRVFATARSASSIVTLQEASPNIEPLSLEVHKLESIQALRTRVEELTHGRGLDILVNNAGRNYTVPTLDVDFDEVQSTFEVNVFGVMRMCQEFAPLLIKRKGTIVQIGSVAGIMPYAFGGVYNASKAALHAFSNTLRVELQPFGVKVVTVVTGAVQSNIARTERELPPGSFFTPVNTEYQRRLKHSQEGAMPSDDYARSVVDKVLGKSYRLYIWEGNKSWLVWFISNFLPQSTMDVIFRRMFNLWKLSGGQKL